ncbi:hypothetical protein AGMMS50255_4600 [Spirochaetia bacterium]|nr:hypothetical protein AGMMS50255_4600 [Spirochaetia bacterium]
MENVKNLLKLYENLHALNKPLADLLNELLPSLSPEPSAEACFPKGSFGRGSPPDWWRTCVMEKMYEQDAAIITREGVTTLYELDMEFLLKILIRNWQDLSNLYKDKFDSRKKELTMNVRNIRNFTAHPSEAAVASADFIMYFERLQRFAVFIGTNIDEAVELLYKENEKNDNEKRNRLFALLNTKVIEPALNCPGLIQDIKESVRDTLKRLEKTNTAKDIYNWFYDALDSRRGGQVYDALRDNNLTAFEDIIEEFSDIYWRN